MSATPCRARKLQYSVTWAAGATESPSRDLSHVFSRLPGRCRSDDLQIPPVWMPRSEERGDANAESLECYQVPAIIPAPQAQVAELADALG